MIESDISRRNAPVPEAEQPFTPDRHEGGMCRVNPGSGNHVWNHWRTTKTHDYYICYFCRNKVKTPKG